MSLGPFTQLGITRASSTEDIKAAYKVLVKKHHPDMGGTKEGFIELKKTYDRLIQEREMPPVEERLQPRISVLGWGLTKDGVGIIEADFQLMICAFTIGKLLGRYDWTLIGSRGGYFEISKKDLARCDYKVEITWMGLGFSEITKTYEFVDNRSGFRKFIDWLRFN